MSPDRHSVAAAELAKFVNSYSLVNGDCEMKTRTLGSSGLEVSAIGLGCMGINFHRGEAIETATPSRCCAARMIAA